MLVKLRENNNRKIGVFILIIALIVAALPIMSMAGDGNDITDSGAVSYKGFEMYRNDVLIASSDKGSLITSADAIRPGQTLDIKYFWSVNQTDDNVVTAGSFFLIDLPDLLDFDPINGAVLKSSSGVVIGSIDLIADGGKQQIKITLNETAAKRLPLTGGWIWISGMLSDDIPEGDEPEIFGVPVEINVTPTESEDGDGGGGGTSRTDPGEGFRNVEPEPTNYNNTFDKTYSSYDKNSGDVTYNLFANYDQYRLKYAGSTSYSALDDVFIEDKLPDNVLYAGNLNVTIPIYTVKAEYAPIFATTTAAFDDNISYGAVTATSGNALGLSDGSIYYVGISVSAVSPSKFYKKITEVNVTDQFTKYEPPNPMIGYDDFKTFIKNQGPMSYGIWQNKTLVIYIGNIQNENFNMGISWDNLKDRINNCSNGAEYRIYTRNASGQALDTDGNVWKDSTRSAISYTAISFQEVTSEVKNKTIEAYENLYSTGSGEPSGDAMGQSVGFSVSFKANISGDSRSIKNTATMYYQDTSTPATSTEVKYKQMSGGADMANPGDIILVKYDGDTYKPLEGVEFKLQKWNQRTNKYEDLVEGDNGYGTYITDENGKVTFRQLDYGKYKIIETKTLGGYTDEVAYYNHNTLKYQDTFELAEPDIIEFTAYNYKENVLGEEGYSTYDEGDVLGEEADPDPEAESVLGDEAKTADVTKLYPLLTALFIAAALLTLALIRIRTVGRDK